MTRRTFSFLTAGATLRGAPRRLRITVTPHLTAAPFHLAAERGYFRDAGFELEVLPGTRTIDVIPALSRGDLDVALSAVSTPLTNAIAKGVKIRLVGCRLQAPAKCGDVGGIYARREITSVAGLKGKRVAVSTPSAFGSFAFEMSLAKAGLAHDACQRVALTGPDAAAALLRGDVDAITGPDFSSLAALKRPEVRVLGTLGDALPGFQYGFITFGRKLMEGPVEEGARFLRAALRGNREFAAGATPRFVDEYAAQSGLDVKAARAQCRGQHDVTGKIEAAHLDRFTGWCHERGFSDTRVEGKSLVDERFLHAMGRLA